MIPALPPTRTLSIQPGLHSVSKYDYPLHHKKGGILHEAFAQALLDQVLLVARKFLHPPEERHRFNFRTHFGDRSITLREALGAVPYLETVYCSKCPFARSCPFFLKHNVCYLISSVLNAERTEQAFTNRLMESIRIFSFASTIFMQQPTDEDVDVAAFLVLLTDRLETDKTLPDRRVDSNAKGGRKTKMGRRVVRNHYTASINEQRKKIERRWENLGLPPRPHQKDYYPKN